MQEGELSEFTGNMTDRLLNVVGPYNWFNYFFSPNLQILGPQRDQRGFFFLLQADILLTPAGNVRTLPNITKMFCVYVMSCHVILYYISKSLLPNPLTWVSVHKSKLLPASHPQRRSDCPQENAHPQTHRKQSKLHCVHQSPPQ